MAYSAGASKAIRTPGLSLRKPHHQVPLQNLPSTPKSKAPCQCHFHYEPVAGDPRGERSNFFLAKKQISSATQQKPPMGGSLEMDYLTLKHPHSFLCFLFSVPDISRSVIQIMNLDWREGGEINVPTGKQILCKEEEMYVCCRCNRGGMTQSWVFIKQTKI